MSSQRLLYIANVKEIPPGESKIFTYPVGDPKGMTKPGLLVHVEDQFVAYEGLCTHMQAEIRWNKYTGKIWCTMHDGMYDPKTGRPFMGMPREPLEKIEIRIEENGDIYAVF